MLALRLAERMRAGELPLSAIALWVSAGLEGEGSLRLEVYRHAMVHAGAYGLGRCPRCGQAL